MTKVNASLVVIRWGCITMKDDLMKGSWNQNEESNGIINLTINPDILQKESRF